ncbi:MAG: cytochrome c-type biogenesis protein CcmH [Chloroflexi bacterium]|nr:cytochrome c-type biogenesis protein CcmH [Chloroflexota bacterium]
MARRLALAALVVAMGLLTMAGPGVSPSHAGSIVDEVEGKIICQCGCTYTLEACASAMGCSVGDQMRAEIAAMGAQGMTAAQVLDSYVARYGEAILAAPTKRGFNLTAWVTPFAAIAAGGAVVYLLLQAWWRRHILVTGATQERRRAALDPFLEQVDRELEEES